MKQKQLHELIQSHHPEMKEGEIRLRLNNALKEFCRKTRILQGAFKFTTQSGQRYYGLDEKIIEITNVDYDGESIERLSGRPDKRDLT
tara:strand:+ start:135 stop:398 length:264 start_codon:yes stop_codon:yes gene_type:complete